MTALLLALSLSVAHAQETPTPAEAEAALEGAYQREVAYLLAERRALRDRLDALAEQRRTEAGRADTRVASLQGRVLGLERRADAVEHHLDALSEATLAASERAALLESTLQQAEDALDLELSDDLSDAGALRQVYTTAVDGLQAGTELEATRRAFFLPDGTQVDGTVVRIGQIGAYGVSDSAAGPLLPLGDGRLMLRADAAGTETARALARGERPDHLGLFLLESLDKAVSERTERTALETIEAGGLVAWVIVGLGLLALVLSAARATLLVGAGRGEAEVSAVLAALQQGDVATARRVTARPSHALGRVLDAVLTAPLAPVDDPREPLQDIAAAAILEEQPTIERFGALILVVAAVAPLLGLLGTVTGMIATFEIITEFGTGDPGMLSGGIGEALITTQLGLVVAIPTVLLGNVLKGRQADVLRRLDHAALQAINLRCDVPAAEAAPAPAPQSTEASPARRPVPPRSDDRSTAHSDAA